MTTINTSNMIPFTPLPVPLTWFVSDVGNRLAQQNQTAVTAPHDVKMRPPTSGQPATGGLTYAPNVASLSQNHRSDTRPVTAPQPAKNEPSSDDTGSGKKAPCNGSVAPPNSRGYVDPPQVGECAYCGRPLTRKSRNGRLPKYCGTPCRVAHWRQRQKDGGNEAGRGRVDFALFMLTLIVAVAVLWFFWPLLQQIAAMRPTLPATPTAVPVYPVTWPEAPQAAPTAVPQAAPDLVVTAVSPAPAVVPAAIVTNDVKPAPTAVPVDQGQPAPAGGIITIEAAGRTWHLTSERLADCVTAQAAGRQTGMACPPNAAKYAGAPGTPAQALYSQFNGRLAYCLAGGGWTPEYSQTLAAAFDAWSGSGVNFSLVDMGTSCQLPVSLVYNPSSAYAGRASEGPIGAWLAMNTYYGFNALVAMHEIGHVLGLGHWPSGVMTADGYYTAPGAAELAAVAALWGGGGR